VADTERKEWFAVERSAKGGTVARVTVQEANFTSKFALVTHGADLKVTVTDVRKRAHEALDALIEAVGK
jgi:hypothetical protein